MIPTPASDVDGPPLPLRIAPEIQAIVRRRGDGAHPILAFSSTGPGAAKWKMPEHAPGPPRATTGRAPRSAGPATCTA
jgi:hypothetical protein